MEGILWPPVKTGWKIFRRFGHQPEGRRADCARAKRSYKSPYEMAREGRDCGWEGGDEGAAQRAQSLAVNSRC